MVETAIVAQWLHRGNIPLHYAAWHGGEVDLVMVAPAQKPRWVMEVKWSNQYVQSPGKLKSLLKYCKENALGQAWVTSIDKVEQALVQGIKIVFFPAAAYCFGLGRESLHEKQVNTVFETVFDLK
jgi:hypothetical protein